MNAAAKPDPVSALLSAAEGLRGVARGIESIQLSEAESRQDLRSLLGDIRREAFVAITLAAFELRPRCVDEAERSAPLESGRQRVHERRPSRGAP